MSLFLTFRGLLYCRTIVNLISGTLVFLKSVVLFGQNLTEERSEIHLDRFHKDSTRTADYRGIFSPSPPD